MATPAASCGLRQGEVFGLAVDDVACSTLASRYARSPNTWGTPTQG